jgi:hypothetical protein
MEKRGFYLALFIVLAFVLIAPALDDAITGKISMNTAGGRAGPGINYASSGSSGNLGGGDYPAGYKVLWKFDDDPNDGVEDSSVYGINGDCGNNCPDLGNGMFGNSYVFRGDDYIDFGNNDFGFVSSDEFTIAFWIKPYSISGTQEIIERGQYVNPFRIQLEGDELAVRLRTSSTTPILYSNTNFQIDRWYHVAITYKDGERIIYVDGDIDVQDGFNGDFDTGSGDTNIGKHPGVAEWYLNGELDEFIIYDKVLVKNEVEQLMGGSSTGFISRPKPCKLGTTKWEVLEAIEGEEVELSVQALPGTDCEGESVSFDVYNSQGGASSNPANANFIGSTAVGSWNAEYSDYIWVFDAMHGSGIVTSGNTLTVPDCGNDVLESPEVCDTDKLDGKECVDFPQYDGGTLACLSTCDDFDFTGCTSPPPTDYIIVDHTSVFEFEYLAQDPYWVGEAKKIATHWGHRSHGSQMFSGLKWIKNSSKYGSPLFDAGIEKRNDPRIAELPNMQNTLLMYEEALFPGTTIPNNGTKHGYWWKDNPGQNPQEDQAIVDTKYVLDSGLFNASGWIWCGGVSSCPTSVQYYWPPLNCDPSDQYIHDYLAQMNEYELLYPDITFIYATGHKDGNGPGSQELYHNGIIRDYVKNNSKVLYDFADIESWDLDGIYYENEDDNCTWCYDWCDNNPNVLECSTRPADGGNGCTVAEGGELACDFCPHSHGLNCIIKAKAWWVLMAKIAGWTGP